MRTTMIAVLATIFIGTAAAQVATGVPPFNSFGGGPFDTINLADLNIHFQVPIMNKSGRGMPFWYVLSYDSSMWMPGTSNGQSTWVQSPNGGWTAQSNGLTGSLTSSGTTSYCYDANGHPLGTIVNTSFTYHDVAGTAHNWPNVWTMYNTGCSGTSSTRYTGGNGDGSGLTLTANQGSPIYVTAANGTILQPTTLIQDRNGNQITTNGTTFYDTLSATTAVLTISNPSSSSDPTYNSETDYTYQAPAGPATIKAFSNTVTLQANFGCSYAASAAQSTSLIQKILFPDGSYYLFTYEPTSGAPAGYYTGRITSVQLPTGGTISYSYTNGTNGVICADGSTAGVTRTSPDDASQSQHWSYTRSGSGSSWTTTVIDPASSTTTINFSGPYETQRVITDSGNHTLATVITCYNGSTDPSTCATASVNSPITQKNVFTQLDSGAKNQVQLSYNTLGLLTDEYDYDYYNGSQYPLVRRTHTDYATLGSIAGLPSQVTTYDGNSNIKAQTTYSYDEYTSDGTGHAPLQGTSAAQHVSISGARGNITTIQRRVDSGSSLSSYFSYFDTGNVYVATDVTGAQTTYAYGACSNAFPTSASKPFNLNRSMAWDCNGGMTTSITDENNQQSTTTFTDSYFWRPNNTKDELLNQTTFTFGANPPTTVEATMNFNGNVSTSDVLNTVDSLGRPMLAQRRQAPGSSNFDSVETDYDVLGRSKRVSLAYSGTAGQTNSTAPAVTTLYDGLSRPSQVSDAGGGYTSYAYSQNTTTVTVGPAPSGETTKQRQLIYDGVGRLVQVNEPSPIVPAAAGSGTVTVNGSEHSNTQAATSGSTTITVAGNQQSTQVGCPYHCQTIYNSGNVYVTIGSTQYTGGYGGSTATAASVANSLASSMNSGTQVSATVNGSSITVTALASGFSTDYSVSTSCTYYTQYFNGCAFSASGSDMTGGQDGGTTYDNGTVSVTVNNGTPITVSYGQGSTNSSVAAALASAINANSTIVTASAPNNVITITSKTTGYSTNYSLTATSSSANGFSPPSFTTSTPGSSLSGGRDQSGGLTTPYQTLYTYNALDELATVTQNAQDVTQNQQTRSYTYDGLGRLTQEITPEAGTVNYTYDRDGSGQCAGTYKGDLVKKVDAIGNVTCFAYDVLHRVTDITYPYGAYANSTDAKHFVYGDTGTVTVDGVVMANAKGRLAEAYTGSSSSKKTDEGFSYSARGEITDVYESTAHSGGWYHVSASYWANGAGNQLSGVPGVPTIYFGKSDGSGLDGQGRPIYVSAASGQQPVTATTYNVAGLPTALTFGSGDSDNFSFDSNTNRLTQYKFNVGATPQAVVGNLTWNGNGSLQQLAITDPFDSANQQTCTYQSDQLARISSVSCGSTWGQTFTYDVFGNISKSGSSSWAASYQNTTNRISSVGGVNPTYDANGNLTNDSAHSYGWSVDGDPVTIDTVSITYDALGRAVEQNRSGVYTQMLYGPAGDKLALMNGQTLSKAFIALAGGATAVYSSGGLSYYRHPDWLGNSRFASTANRTTYYDGAYAPFGESYSETGTTDRSYTGQNQDTVSGLYDFAFREFSPVQGRWVSPDPAGLAAVDLSNPQSLNRYAYAWNNPLKYVDPYGLNICVWEDAVNGDTYDPNPDSREECEGNGGAYWVTDTTVNVTASSDGYVTTIIFGGPAGFITYPADSGGGGGSLVSTLKTATRFYCRVSQPADVRTAGVGGDAGFLGTVGGQLGVAANGKSGELGVTFTLNNDVGFQSFDAYFYGGTVPNAPTNAALGGGFGNALNFTNHLNVGISKFGVTRGDDGSRTFTVGPSVLPFTVSGGTSRTGVLFNIPKLGYVLNWKAAVCSAVGG